MSTKLIFIVLGIAIVLSVGIWGIYQWLKPLPKIEHDFIVLDSVGGIKDLCYIGQKIEDVLPKLGKPDKYEERENSGFKWYYYHYELYGLVIEVADNTGITGNDTDIMAISGIALKNMEAINWQRIKYDREKLIDFPKTRKEIYELFGEPDLVIKEGVITDGNIVNLDDLVRREISWIKVKDSVGVPVEPVDYKYYSHRLIKYDVSGMLTQKHKQVFVKPMNKIYYKIYIDRDNITGIFISGYAFRNGKKSVGIWGGMNSKMDMIY